MILYTLTLHSLLKVRYKARIISCAKFFVLKVLDFLAAFFFHRVISSYFLLGIVRTYTMPSGTYIDTFVCSSTSSIWTKQSPMSHFFTTKPPFAVKLDRDKSFIFTKFGKSNLLRSLRNNYQCISNRDLIMSQNQSKNLALKNRFFQLCLFKTSTVYQCVARLLD